MQELKTEKNTRNCTGRIFPAKCPYEKTHRLSDGINYPTYIGDIFCRANSCGNFAGITADEKIVYCTDDEK